MNRRRVRLWFERAIGAVFVVLAMAVLADLAHRTGVAA
jgi:hypothetical protein